MHLYLKTTKLFLALVLIFSIQTIAQSSQSNELQKTDAIIGSQNLPYANGRLHLNYDNTINPENHRYLDNNQFITGNIVYNGENYFDLKLKYDIREDELVYLPDEENNYIKVTIIREKVTAFSLGSKKFKNLTKELSSKFKKGYYEIVLQTEKSTLFIKHSKTSIEILKNNKKQIEYFAKKEYLVYAKGEYFALDTERDVLQIFPEKKEEIKSYYEKNQKMEKNNKTEFIVSLLKQLK